MRQISVKEIIEATSGELIEGSLDTEIRRVETDSRKIKKDSLFVAIKGKNVDGHDYLEKAVKKGANCLLVSKIPEKETNVSVVLVKDTELAVANLAKAYIQSFREKLICIGVTGSTGKSTTKEMLYSILSEEKKTIANKGNYNNLLGIPLTAFNIEEDTEVAIFEMGMDRPDEMHELAEIVKPDIGIITNIGVSHIENLGSQENILKAKLEISDFFDEKNILIINNDDKFLSSHSYKHKVIRAGRSYSSDFIIFNESSAKEKSISFEISDGEKNVKIKVNVPGLHNATNAALAIAASTAIGLTLEDAKKGLAKVNLLEKRLNFEKAGKIKIIDDTYNASPDSMIAALDVLKRTSGKRRFAILGDMLELGTDSDKYHYEVGEYAASLELDNIITLGQNSEKISQAVTEKGLKALHFSDKDMLYEVLKQWLKEGDVVLVKGSRSMKMDDIVSWIKQTYGRGKSK